MSSHRRGQAERILAIFVESGVLYSLIWVSVFILHILESDYFRDLLYFDAGQSFPP